MLLWKHSFPGGHAALFLQLHLLTTVFEFIITKLVFFYVSLYRLNDSEIIIIITITVLIAFAVTIIVIPNIYNILTIVYVIAYLEIIWTGMIITSITIVVIFVMLHMTASSCTYCNVVVSTRFREMFSFYSCIYTYVFLYACCGRVIMLVIPRFYHVCGCDCVRVCLHMRDTWVYVRYR